MMRILIIVRALLIAGPAAAGPALGARASVDPPAPCTVEHKPGREEIAAACLHREGFVLMARNRRDAGALTVAVGRFGAVIPPGGARAIADARGPSAARLPVALGVAGDIARGRSAPRSWRRS
ncbi:MAG: hypothetical protein R6V44_15950 [Paracoccaceae bacterium]